jgi:hypothetical protein
MVEGHTDNVPFTGSGVLIDNWDLSVKRSTSIVRVLTGQLGVKPSQLIAAGRSSYIPLVENDTEENRGRNRRTRIVVLPKILTSPVCEYKPIDSIDPLNTVDPDTVNIPVISALPITSNEEDNTVDPDTTRLSVPNVPTLVFSTNTPKEPLAIRLVALGFIPVYFIVY